MCTCSSDDYMIVLTWFINKIVPYGIEYKYKPLQGYPIIYQLSKYGLNLCCGIPFHNSFSNVTNTPFQMAFGTGVLSFIKNWEVKGPNQFPRWTRISIDLIEGYKICSKCKKKSNILNGACEFLELFVKTPLWAWT